MIATKLKPVIKEEIYKFNEDIDPYGGELMGTCVQV